MFRKPSLGRVVRALPLAAFFTLLLPLAAQDWHRVSSGGSGGIVAYDPIRQRLVMFDDEFFSFGTWEWDGDEWALRFPARSPSWRIGSAMGFDPVSLRIILFSGVEGSAYPPDTWAWDGTNWERLSPTLSPLPRAYATMVTDETRGRLLMFGGQTGTCGAGPCPLGDLWEWNGADWVLLAEGGGPNRPAAVSGARLAYDTTRQRVVLFGGDKTPGSGNPSNETWEWDGAAWARINTSRAPEGRNEHAMAWDPVSGRVVLYGGQRITPTLSTTFQDTWMYDGADWTLISLTGRPGMVYSKHLIFNPGVGTLVLVAGSNWGFTGSGWIVSSLVPAPPRNPAIAFDEARGRMVMYTGAPATTGGPATEVWEWDGLQLFRRMPGQNPGLTARQSMAYDAARGLTVMVVPNMSPTTWTWNGESWRAAASAVGEGPLAYDAARGVVVQLVTDGKTWTWDGTRWTRREVIGPPARERAALAYDAARQVVVLFGGTTDPLDPGASLNDTWEWNGATWTQANPAISPPARFEHGMAYDPALGAVLLAGGPNETWAWDGTTWSQLSTTKNPVAGVDLAYDSRRSRVVGVEAKWLGTAPYALRLWELGAITAAAATTSGVGCGTVIPSIGTLGVPRVGRAKFAIDVGRAPANAPGALIFSAGTASIPLGSSCFLYIDPTVTVTLPFAASAFGYSSQTIPIPVQVPIGAALYIQGVLLDASSPLGLALTNRLDLTIGE